MYKLYEVLKEQRGVTDYQVSKDAGIPRSTISEWKSGATKKIGLDSLVKLSKYFGVPVDYFLQGMEA